MSKIFFYTPNVPILSPKISTSWKLLCAYKYYHNCRLSLSKHTPQYFIIHIASPKNSISYSNYNITPTHKHNKHYKNNKPFSLFSSKMATCIDTSIPQPTKNCDQTSSQSDHHHFRYINYCRPNFSCTPICPKPKEFIDDHHDYDDDLWSKIMQEAKKDIEQEPILCTYYYNTIFSHKSLESALANHLAAKLSFSSLNSNTLFDLFLTVLNENKEIVKDIKGDLRAVKERDPACISYVHCFLNFKGFLACQSHRIAHKLWSQGRKILALMIQNRVSEVFDVDIHPGAKIGRGILFDHASGVVIGETSIIGNNVSILHNVTLGGTGKICGDRHPKIGDGVLIGAGTCVLGNVKVGDGAKIGAGSVVLKEVPPRTTAVGNPARLIGGKENPIRLDKIPSFTMDQTSHISQWSDYVI